MSFTAISLDRVGTPQVIPQPPHPELLAARKARLLEVAAERGDAAYLEGLTAALALESEALVQLLREDSYREMVLRQDVQDASLDNMLAFAQGAALDHLGAFYGVARQIIQAADDTTSPPIPEILEDDARLRRRVQLAPEGMTNAGTPGSYIFHGLSASPLVKDIDPAETETPGESLITVLSTEGDGTASADLLGIVEADLTLRRPLGAKLIVQSAAILAFELHAVLAVDEGPDAELVRQASEASLLAYVADNHQLGRDVNLARLYAAAAVEGVRNVTFGAFGSDLLVGPQEAAFCSALTVSVGGANV